MRKLIRNLLLSVCAIVVSCSAFANSLAGYWQNIDDHTHLSAGIVHIWQKNGKYYGRIVKIYKQGGNKPTDKCVKCKSVLHNKPILGMVVLRNMTYRGKSEYKGGTILDPKVGKTYKCSMKLIKDGKVLKVRGYIGIPLLGRTQYWYRVGSANAKPLVTKANKR